MLPREVIRQIRRLQLKARRAVEDLLGGEYHSVFKGTGIAFEEVREYQPGDDIRAVDCSGSNQFGTRAQQKREVAAELAAVLAFSAISNNDRVGLVQFTDRVERFLPPRKGTRHVLRLIRDVLFYQPEHHGTSLREGLDFLNRVLHRRTIVFLMSDFLDEGFASSFKRTGRRHDLIALRISDPREEDLPAVGLLELEDTETGERILLDTDSAAVREAFRAAAEQRRAALRQMARQ